MVQPKASISNKKRRVNQVSGERPVVQAEVAGKELAEASEARKE